MKRFRVLQTSPDTYAVQERFLLWFFTCRKEYFDYGGSASVKLSFNTEAEAHIYILERIVGDVRAYVNKIKMRDYPKAISYV